MDLDFEMDQKISSGSSTDSDFDMEFTAASSQQISSGNSMDSDLETELISLVTQLLFVGGDDEDSSWFSMAASVISQIISLVNSTEFSSQPEPESELMSLITQAISVFNSMDSDSQPESLSKFIELLSRKISLGNSTDLDISMDSDLNELRVEICTLEPEPELMFLIHKIFSLVIYLNSKSGKFISMCPQGRLIFQNWNYHMCEEIPRDSYGKWECLPGRWMNMKITGQDATYFWCRGCNGNNHEECKKAPVEIKHHLHPKHSLKLVYRGGEISGGYCNCCNKVRERVFYRCSLCDFDINIDCVKKPPVLSKDHLTWHENTLALFPRHASLPCNLCAFADSNYPFESELISLITQLMFLEGVDMVLWEWAKSSNAVLLISQIISLASSIVPNTQPKPESELMYLIDQIISVFNDMDLDSQPTPLLKFISLLFETISLVNSDRYNSLGAEILMELFEEILTVNPELELMSLIHKVFSLIIFMNPKSQKFITLCSQVLVTLEKGKFQVIEEYLRANLKWECFPGEWLELEFTEENTTYLGCLGCNGKNHEDYKRAPLEIKHHLHPKHYLQLVLFTGTRNRKCYCCDEDLPKAFYCCLSCDIAIRVDCVKKPPVLSIDHPKWHDHPLFLFRRHIFVTCNLCALDYACSPIYMCPNCGFVVHLRCVKLPRVIRISRHHHRISFTSSFNQGDLYCGVCRKKIDNDYGGYFCSKDDCSYVAHSRCATQSNVWDGKELKGEAEEEIEVDEPFVRVSDGIIQHFTHSHHHLRLDENIDRDYDENKQCQTCHSPIYFGNFYSCLQCDFILHEDCANFPRNLYHPIHPHLLILRKYDDGPSHVFPCQACPMFYPTCIYYQCDEEGCLFKLHVKCATIPEPLVHESHDKHPLFLTSKPEEERRICSVCNVFGKETFNCIDECDFSLCFRCATLPQKVRYKHDKHTLTLSYGDETSTTTYWCEACEEKVNPKDLYYVCDEYCCVTLHIECLLGRDLYMKPGQSYIYLGCEVEILPNNDHMSRPICIYCRERCPHKTIIKSCECIFCCLECCSDCLREARLVS